MKLKELLELIEGTQIQQETSVEKYIGSLIEFDTELENIDNKEIHVTWENYTDYYYSRKYVSDDDYIDDPNLHVKIYYDKVKFESQLLSLTRYDRVIVKARLNSAKFAYIYEKRFEFELVSIQKIYNYDEKRHADELAEKKKKELEDELERKKSEWCFIATACYGNYGAPEVLFLRQYRDDKLLKTFYGKIFVKFYYSVSPFFASLISKSDLLKKIIRLYFLEPIIIKLDNKKILIKPINLKLTNQNRKTRTHNNV